MGTSKGSPAAAGTLLTSARHRAGGDFRQSFGAVGACAHALCAPDIVTGACVFRACMHSDAACRCTHLRALLDACRPCYSYKSTINSCSCEQETRWSMFQDLHCNPIPCATNPKARRHPAPVQRRIHLLCRYLHSINHGDSRLPPPPAGPCKLPCTTSWRADGAQSRKCSSAIAAAACSRMRQPCCLTRCRLLTPHRHLRPVQLALAS